MKACVSGLRALWDMPWIDEHPILLRESWVRNTDGMTSDEDHGCSTVEVHDGDGGHN